MADVNHPALEMFASTERRSVLRCAVALGAAVAVLAVVLGPLGFWLDGLPGVWAVLAAGGLCGATGLVAFWVGRYFLGRGQVALGVLGAMSVRMGLPLAVCLMLAVRGNANAWAGFVYYLLVFYMATLAVETWCSVPKAVASPQAVGEVE